jgi:HD-GYP domain-containing protein (c-di-GMP phosphodiesterase class II)
MRLADRALYWAKEGGRNATVLHTPENASRFTSYAGPTVERFQTMSSVRALARAIDSKDVSTHSHSERVAALAEQLALELGWTAKRARAIHAAGLLHDVGKIGISDALLFKPSPLTAAEHDELKRHAPLGGYIAAEVLEAEQVIWIRGHHERWDGDGYPDALSGVAISDGAQLLALADAWDAMTEARAYKPTSTRAEALAECARERDRQFAPAAVDALFRLAARDALPRRDLAPDSALEVGPHPLTDGIETAR